MKTWAARAAGDVRQWLREVAALPWADGFTLADACERLGWKPVGTHVGAGAHRPGLEWDWHHVRGVSTADRTMARFSVALDRWRPAEASLGPGRNERSNAYDSRSRRGLTFDANRASIDVLQSIRPGRTGRDQVRQ